MAEDGLLDAMLGAEDDVVGGAKRGDPEAWRTLYRVHGPRLVAWLSTRTTGDQAASPEDVAQQAWLVAASKIADFEGGVDEFGGWLFTIARKSGAGVRRRTERRRTEPTEITEDLVAAPDPTSVIDTQDWLRDALSALPPRERDVVALVDGLGFDTRTAAETLGISAVALRVARHRGLRRLRAAQAVEPEPIALPPDPAVG